MDRNNNGNSSRTPCTNVPRENRETRPVPVSQDQRARNINIEDQYDNSDIQLENCTPPPNKYYKRMMQQLIEVDHLFSDTGCTPNSNVSIDMDTNNSAGSRTPLTEASISAQDEAVARVERSRPANINRGNRSIVAQPPSVNDEHDPDYHDDLIQSESARVVESLENLGPVFGEMVSTYAMATRDILHTDAEHEEKE